MRTGQMLYDDGKVALDSGGITLRGYYFPFGQSKYVRYVEIRDVRTWAIGSATGKWRLWGSGDLRRYAPLDRDRPHKHTAILLDLGRRIEPWFTPDDPDAVLSLLCEHTGRDAS